MFAFPWLRSFFSWKEGVEENNPNLRPRLTLDLKEFLGQPSIGIDGASCRLANRLRITWYNFPQNTNTHVTKLGFFRLLLRIVYAKFV